MKKKPIVFSLVHDQSVFMTAIMSLLTFISVLALGLALAIGTGVMRWNAQWDLFATVQVMDSANTDATRQTINRNQDKMLSVREISSEEMSNLMRPWLSGGKTLSNYLPQMWEIQFKSKSDLTSVQPEFEKTSRFLTHASALKTSTSAGWKMIAISILVLSLTLGSIGVCISYIARNTAMLHRRELEILNQIGASDNFVARQMQKIVARIATLSATCGFLVATPVLLLILATAHSSRVGLMSMLNLSGWGWFTLLMMAILIIVFAIWITRRTTLNILRK